MVCSKPNAYVTVVLIKNARLRRNRLVTIKYRIFDNNRFVLRVIALPQVEAKFVSSAPEATDVNQTKAYIERVIASFYINNCSSLATELLRNHRVTRFLQKHLQTAIV